MVTIVAWLCERVFELGTSNGCNGKVGLIQSRVRVGIIPFDVRIPPMLHLPSNMAYSFFILGISSDRRSPGEVSPNVSWQGNIDP